jgi:glutamate synthase domain-containing protein 2
LIVVVVVVVVVVVDSKLSQGAKPGKGGVLPAAKVTRNMFIKHIMLQS